MSALAGLSRRTVLPLSSSRLPAIASVTNAFPTFQTRGKAAAVVKKKQPQTKMKSKGPPRRDGEPAKKEKKLGAFVALPVNQLSHPVFRSAERQVLDLPVFGKDPLRIGEAMAFAAPEDDPMRKFGLPRSMLLEFRLLSRPCSVVRDVTASTLDILNAASSLPSSNTRAVLTGPSGCGKSFLLLQALEHCVQQKWIVLYVPRATNLVNSSSTYTYDMRTQVYSQPVFAHQTLLRLLGTNASILNSLQTKNDIELERRAPLPAGTSLAELISVGTKDQSLAPTVLQAVLAELGSQDKHPVLLAIDDFQAIYCTSTYRDPLFSRIKPWHLSMPRLLLEYASGQKSFARGAVLGALSHQNSQFALPLELRESLKLPYDQPTGARIPRSKILQDYSQGLRNIAVPAQLSVDEAASLFEVWMKDRALYGVSEDAKSASDETFLAKYTESSGNARNFVQKGLLSSLSYTGGV